MSDISSFAHVVQDSFISLAEGTNTTDVYAALRTLKRHQIPPVGQSLNDSTTPYPLDKDGYAVALSLLEDPIAVRSCFDQYGFVVVGSIATVPDTERLILRAEAMISALQQVQGISSIGDNWWNAIPVDSQGAPLYSRGFLELYHDHAWAAVRQNPLLYLLWVTLWGRPDVWTTFDRLGVKPPGCDAGKGLPLHVDQNPLLDPGFCSLQGILALRDCPEAIGTTVVALGSRRRFQEWAALGSPVPGKHYIELEAIAELAETTQRIPLRRGSILVWDSRLAHANTTNRTEADTRWVALIASGVARGHEQVLVSDRYDAVLKASGWNNRAALLYASKRPRFYDPVLMGKVRQAEQLTTLGSLLYGADSYEEVWA